MPVPSRTPTNSSPDIKSFGDLDELLRVADALEDKCRDLVDTLWRRKLAMVTALFAYGISLGWLFINGYIRDYNQYYFSASSVVAVVFIIAYWIPSIRRTRRDLASDQRTRDRLVDFLRALEPQLANGSAFSFAEWTAFRIRVARFGIGPEWDGLRIPSGPKPASPLEPQPVPLHDAREVEQPSHS